MNFGYMCVQKEAAASVVAATAFTTPSIVAQTSPATAAATVLQTGQALVAPTDTKVSLATQALLTPPIT